MRSTSPIIPICLTSSNLCGMTKEERSTLMRKRTLVLCACVVCGMLIGCAGILTKRQQLRSSQILSDAVPVPEDWEQRLEHKDRIVFQTGQPPFEIWYIAAQASSVFGLNLADTLCQQGILNATFSEFGREVATNPLASVTVRCNTNTVLRLHYVLMPRRTFSATQ